MSQWQTFIEFNLSLNIADSFEIWLTILDSARFKFWPVPVWSVVIIECSAGVTSLYEWDGSRRIDPLSISCKAVAVCQYLLTLVVLSYHTLMVVVIKVCHCRWQGCRSFDVIALHHPWLCKPAAASRPAGGSSCKTLPSKFSLRFNL